jgi:hypothetical protein
MPDEAGGVQRLRRIRVTVTGDQFTRIANATATMLAGFIGYGLAAMACKNSRKDNS